MFHRCYIALTLLGAAPLAAQTATPASPPQSAAQDAKYLALGKTYIRWLLTDRADSLATAFPADVLERIGGTNAIRERMNEIAGNAGTERKVLVEKMNRRNGRPQFWHEAEFSLMDEPLVIRFIFDSAGKIVGTGMGPKSTTPAPDNN